MSVYITDTHPLIWYAGGEHRNLSKKVLRIFDRAWQGQAFIYVPAAVLWEIAILIKIGQIRIPTEFDWWMASITTRTGFDVAPIDLNVVAEFLQLHVNGDPFDEAIVATTRIKDLPLITRDEAISNSNLVDIIW